jgi:hypothetical protein
LAMALRANLTQTEFPASLEWYASGLQHTPVAHSV